MLSLKRFLDNHKSEKVHLKKNALVKGLVVKIVVKMFSNNSIYA